MRVQFLEREKETIIPEPGECWKHPNSTRIYMRLSITEELGKLLFPVIENSPEEHIFSVGLDIGEIFFTSVSSYYEPIIIVKPNNKEKTMYFINK